MLIFTGILIYSNYINPHHSLSLENSDHIGSFIGGTVGAFFSFGSFLLIIATLQQQKDEFLKSEKTNNIRQFESLFLQLLNFHQNLKDAISTNVELLSPTVKKYREENEEDGVDGIGFFDDFCEAISLECEDIHAASIEQQLRIFMKYFRVHVSDIGHYFRNLFHLVRYVDETELIADDKRKFYIRLIRSQLTNSELICLGYNGLTSNGTKFKPLIEKYALLENIDFELLIGFDYTPRIYNPEQLVHFYPHLEKVYNEQLIIKNQEMPRRPLGEL